MVKLYQTGEDAPVFDMPHALLADLVLAVHAAFVLFVVFGGLLALRWRWLAWLHLPAAAWGAWVSLAGWVCPLTPLENRFRRLAGAGGYQGSFLEHYVVPVLYPAGLTREVQIALGVGVLLLNAVVYWLWWRRRETGPSEPGARPGSM